MSGKLGIPGILERQVTTFRGYSLAEQIRDFATFILLPIGTGILVGRWGPDVVNAAPVLAGVAVFTALLFALLVNVLTLAVKLRRDEGLRTESRIVRDVEELFANVSWSVVVGLLLVSLLVPAAAVADPAHPMPQWLAGLLAGVFAHLVITVIMAVSRLNHAFLQIRDLAPK